MMRHIDAMRELAMKGETRAVAARALGLHYETVKALSRRYKVPFKHGNEKALTKRPRQVTPVQAMKNSGALNAMTAQEKIDTLTLMRKGGYSATEALRAVGRHDLADQFFGAERVV